MRRAIAVVALGMLAVLPGTASAGNLDLRLGAFLPRTDSNLFVDDAALYVKDGNPLQKKDWRGFAGGIGYNAKLAPNIELGVHLDGYGRTLHTSYRDFVTDSGREIQQSLKLEIVPLGVSLRIIPTSRHARFTPFVAGGADLFFYNYEEFGDFVDFDDPANPVISDAFKASGVAGGFHVGGGLGVAVTDDIRLVGEYRYLIAKDDMGDDFRGNEIDLSGSMITFGVNVRF